MRLGDPRRLRVAIALAIGAPLLAAGKPADAWRENDGVELAANLMNSCLANNIRDAYSCVLVPYMTCEDQHGTASQPEMADCAVFARRAWAADYAQSYRELSGIAEGWRLEKSDDWRSKAAAQLVELDEAWKRAASVECELQIAPYRGGTIAGVAEDLCTARHTAVAAIEARRLLEKWR